MQKLHLISCPFKSEPSLFPMLVLCDNICTNQLIPVLLLLNRRLWEAVPCTMDKVGHFYLPHLTCSPDILHDRHGHKLKPQQREVHWKKACFRESKAFVSSASDKSHIPFSFHEMKLHPSLRNCTLSFLAPKRCSQCSLKSRQNSS